MTSKQFIPDVRTSKKEFSIADGKSDFSEPAQITRPPSLTAKPKKLNEDDDDSLDSESEESFVSNVPLPKDSDDLLRMCGDVGVWQVMIFMLGCLCGFNTAMEGFIYTFIADAPDHWCALPDISALPGNHTEMELKTLLIPMDKSKHFSKCQQYKYSIVDEKIIVDHKTLLSCNETQYGSKNFAQTIATEWDLICDDAFWLSSVQAAYMVGILVGSVVFGSLSDKIGRKETIWIGSFMFFIVAPVVGLSPNFNTLLITRFFLGMATPGVYSTTYVLVVEVIGSEKRGIAGALFCIPFSVGYMVLPAIAYFIRNWRQLQLTCACLSSLLFISWWYLPESPRWLLLAGRAKEAEKVFRQIAKANGKADELPKNFSLLVAGIAAKEKEKKQTSIFRRMIGYVAAVFQLLRTRRLRLRTLVLSFAYFAIALVYFGIAMDAENLGFDKYLFTFLCGLFEIPADILTLPMIESCLGRRITFAAFLILCGSFLLISLLLASGSLVSIVLVVLAQLFVAADSSLIYLYSSELYPTILRSYGLGIVSMIGRTGSIIAPFIVELLGEKDKTLPTIIFGTVALLAGLLSLILPETRNKKLPETIAEVEAGVPEKIGKDSQKLNLA